MAIIEDDADFFADDADDAPKGKQRKNVVTFEIDVDGTPVNEHNEDNSDEFMLALDNDGSMEIDFDEADPEQDIIVEDAPAPQPAAPKKDENSERRSSRAQERIRELSKRAKDKEAEAALYKESLENVSALYLESEKNRLNTELAQVKKDISTAAADQDTEAYAEALVKLQDVTQKLSLLNNAEPIKAAPQAQQEEATSFSEAAETWMDGKEFILNNAEYAKLPASTRKQLYPIRQDLANIARELIKEGWHNSTPEFYEELDMRMSLKHDIYDALALEGVDALQSEGKQTVTTKPPSSGETSKPTTRTAEDRKKAVPVNGPTSSGSSTSSRKNLEKVKLSKEEMSWWENHVRFSLGQDNEITLKEYAKMVMDERKKEAQNG